MNVSIGTTAFFAGNYTPDTRSIWIPCEGQSVKENDYRILYSAIGSRLYSDHGNFNLPTLENLSPLRNIICSEGQYPPTFEEENYVAFVTTLKGNTVPNGWELCDGHSLSPFEYPMLHSIIGYNFGSEPKSEVNGMRKFYLPKLNKQGGKQYIICVNGEFPTEKTR